jgi:beta-xylosidase
MGPDMFANPVIRKDFPDPDVLKVGDAYYVYATNTGSLNVQAARSTDLVNWQLLPDAMPVLPPWAEGGNTWAPEVTTWDGGQTFVLYFTARIKNAGRQCIGVATADKPEGPFRSDATEPWICDLGEGGDIDASSFMDEDGTKYVLWKNDGNCCAGETWLQIQTVSDDGLTRTGERTKLIKQEGHWEGNVIEAPTLWKHEGKYYLFYSANAYNSLNYAVGYAVADDIRGPYTKYEDNPILFSDLTDVPTPIGPGGQDIVVDPDGDLWMVYHAWDPTVTDRRMNIDELVFNNGVPEIVKPYLGPQQKP